MILPESRSLEWIKKVAKQNRPTNPILVEKVIRAFSLLESLARSGCPFIFKGGSSLMLHFGSSRRLSIDVDMFLPVNVKTASAHSNGIKHWQFFTYIIPFL